jgi:peptidoglycan-N-acetylglucosamine deacetylase
MSSYRPNSSTSARTPRRGNVARTPHACLRIVVLATGVSLGFATSAAQTRAEAACNNVGSDPSKLGVTRVVEIDTSSGPMLGAMTKLPHEPSFLLPGEVVLTFDDGPMPWITRAILATLEQHCTRATFFSVGKMAVAYPNVLREVMERGHTIGTHTWSHPLNLKRLKTDAAIAEMERGFAAVATAAGQPIAPFFRFPGLSDSPALVDHLKRRQVASVTVDVVSNDSFINDPARLVRETMTKIEANKGGIVLFHDIKASTAKALPEILRALADRGYKVVHMVAKNALSPKHDLVAQFEPQVNKLVGEKARTKTTLVPFFGTVGPERASGVTTVAEPLTAREGGRDDPKPTEGPVADTGQRPTVQAAQPETTARVWVQPSAAWITSIRRTFAD